MITALTVYLLIGMVVALIVGEAARASEECRKLSQDIMKREGYSPMYWACKIFFILTLFWPFVLILSWMDMRNAGD